MTKSDSRPNFRNTSFVLKESSNNYVRAIQSGLMQVTIKERRGKTVRLSDDREVVEFVNCSYLGLDVHPDVVKASQSVDATWGVRMSAARSRFTTEPLRLLEDELSKLYKGHAVVFPSTTDTHLSIMPLLASGVLLDERGGRRTRVIFDQFAHASMQFLKPVLATEASVVTIPHNSFAALIEQVRLAHAQHETPIYVADGVYSMGGLCPILELLSLAEELDFHLYVDDAHGTTIFGDQGEGSVLCHIEGDMPDRLILPFSLSKGFGAYGGGVLLPHRWQEQLIRSYGQIYSFSTPPSFQGVEACRAVVDLHRQGAIGDLQDTLRDRVRLFDELMGREQDFSPIRMFPVGPEEAAIGAAEALLHEGFFTSVVFFPIVRRGEAQIRVSIAANHSESEIAALAHCLRRILPDTACAPGAIAVVAATESSQPE